MSTTLANSTAYNATLSHNGSVATGLGQLAVELPECVALCIVSELPKAACTSANSTCICTDESLNAAVGVCVQADCTIIEALRTQELPPLAKAENSALTTVISKKQGNITLCLAANRSDTMPSQCRSSGPCLPSLFSP
ncbi:hypothetical protein CTA2_2002 [Colletotrichum tanaceti]|uniref:CFEM domain-containing protein n=1 Tax=Colletotrichum tanaceti TaxID=1306861 RepID=A0A4U6XEC9_9PEZI|nr:hypothetical protein CTA2_2002 [Colletotrichum tanaceti]TKW53522.1 hypothetical protein CTA1_4315 [Colletotrichum tanaceti]